jgi:CelD/BcsL family acetyltransferase involved in cellulose biosynthesis
MPVRIIQGEDCQEILRDESFRSQWELLYEACPWATGLQRPGFVIPWCHAYGDRYRILLICEFSSSHDLIGLLPVAIENASGQATLPGAHQAEYKTWLALPSNSRSFIEQGLDALAQETRISSLSFRYLAPGTPVDWVGNARESAWICQVGKDPRAIIRVADAVEVADYLAKKNSLKSTKSKWNRLKRLGKISFDRLVNASELAPIFDQLISYYEMRQGTMYGKRAFQDDPAKKPFHLALLQEPNLLHVTVLKAGGEIVSASFGFVSRDTYSLAMSMFSPAHAHYSPVTLHFLLLVEQLHKQGFSVLDLTAGPDPFKERFASDYDSVQVLSWYANRRVWVKRKVRQQGESLARRVLHAWGIAPHAARLRLQQLLRAPLRTSGAGLAHICSPLFRSFRRSAALAKYANGQAGEIRDGLPAGASQRLRRTDHLE